MQSARNSIKKKKKTEDKPVLCTAEIASFF